MIRMVLVAVLILVGLSHHSFAQSRDVYTVTGISVDERGENVIEAQRKAFTSAKIIGARLLIGRLTTAEDRLAANLAPLSTEEADRLAAAVDVEEEVAGAGRYRGQLAVVFNPRAVRAYLDQNQLAFTDEQAPKAVLISATDQQDAYSWNLAWPDTSLGRLVPLVTSRSNTFPVGSDWPDLMTEVNLYGVRRAILAELSGSEGFYRVRVNTVTPAGRRELGVTPAVNSLQAAVQATQDLLDEQWKRASIVRETGRTMTVASLRYTSLSEWNTLRQALLRSPLVSEVQTRAIALDGAVIEFAYVGDGTRLRSDLRERGLNLQTEPSGWVITSAMFE